MKHRTVRIFLVISALLGLLLSGCASVPMAPMERDATAKQFTPPPDKASLYIYRNEVFGAAIPMTVLVNGNNIGQTASKTYFHLMLQPGEYDIDSITENTSTLTIKLEQQRQYFVWQEVKMGMWMARSLLQQVDEATGRAGVNESKLIKTLVADDKILPIGATPPDSIPNQIRELDRLRQEGILTDDEFKQKKRELLDKL